MGDGLHLVHAVQDGCLLILPAGLNSLQEETDVRTDTKSDSESSQEAENSPGISGRRLQQARPPPPSPDPEPDQRGQGESPEVRTAPEHANQTAEGGARQQSITCTPEQRGRG